MKDTLLKLSQNRYSNTKQFKKWKYSLSTSTISSSSLSLSSNNNSNSIVECNILILHRTLTKYSQNLFDKKRRWSDKVLSQIIENMKSNNEFQSICEFKQKQNNKLNFLESNIKYVNNIRIFSDNDEMLMKCLTCQIYLFHQTDIVIGVCNFFPLLIFLSYYYIL